MAKIDEIAAIEQECTDIITRAINFEIMETLLPDWFRVDAKDQSEAGDVRHKAWIAENCTHRTIYNDGSVLFQNKEEAALFKTFWS